MRSKKCKKCVIISSKECPTGQVRYSDHCYQEAPLSADADILKNADSCYSIGGSLWFPETNTEMIFVASTFPTSSNVYHLGISQYMAANGIIYSDNSFGVGIPFYTCE